VVSEASYRRTSRGTVRPVKIDEEATTLQPDGYGASLTFSRNRLVREEWRPDAVLRDHEGGGSAWPVNAKAVVRQRHAEATFGRDIVQEALKVSDEIVQAVAEEVRCG
jgi:hypothetical protein